MSRSSRIASMATLVALAACDRVGRDQKDPELKLQGSARPAPDVRAGQRLPAFAIRGLESRSVLEVPPAEMRAALVNTYRVPPDRRILGAVADAHYLLTGLGPDTVTTTFRDGKWTVDYAGEHVGELPDLPSFADGNKLLVEWGRRLIERHPIDRGTAPSSDELTHARGLVSNPQPVEILLGLQSIDRAWQGTYRREWLVPAADGLVLLAVQVPRVEVVGDPIATRALAVVALTQATNLGDSLARTLPMLAEYMGYSADARALAARLPTGDPVRLYVDRDTAGLRADSASLARFLYLAELSRGGDGGAWRVWHDRLTARDAGTHAHDDENEDDHDQALEPERITSGILGRALEFARFRSNESIPPQMSKQLGVELRAVAARSGRSSKSVGEWQDLLETWVNPLASIPFVRDLRITSWLQRVSVERRSLKLRRFDEDVHAVAGDFRGRFLDPAIVRTYFQAQMHQAFERACTHLVAGEDAVNDARLLASAFESASEPLWKQSSRWCSQVASEHTNQPTTAQLIASVRELSSMSDDALEEVLDVVESRFTFNGFLELDAARAVFARLDSRPTGLYRAGLTAGTMLKDLPLAERYYDRVVALAPGDHEYLESWYAFYRNDVSALFRLASNQRLPHDARLGVLTRMLARGVDSATVVARARELVAEPGCPWQVREDVVWEILEPARRFEDAARVFQDWLDAHPDAGFGDRIFATIGLARQLQSMGRLEEAWETLPRSVRDCHARRSKHNRHPCGYPLGVLQRTALIALDRGDVETARRFARDLRRYYGSVPRARLTLAEIEWRTGDDATAALIIADPAHALSEDEWRDVMAPGFLRVVGKRSVDDARRAFVTLISAGIDARQLGVIPRMAWRRGQYELAAALGKELARVGDPRIFNPRVYRYVRAAHGDSAALSWITSRWPPPQGLIPAADAYRASEFDLLWTISTQPDVGADGSFIWLMRALGELQQPKRDPKRWRALEQHYRNAGHGAYDIAGRYLVGREREETIIALATSAKRRVEYSYYLAIKALSEGRYRDASDWLHVTVETRQTRDGEFIWAKELLTDWWRTERPLPDAAKQIIASPLQ